VAERLGWRFAKLWMASTTSALGSGLATIAAPLFVAAHTKSPLIVSATFGAAWLPWLLFALPGGVLVDRVDRRRLMVIIDWIRVAAMGVLATALLTGRAGIALLDAVLFVINSGEVVFRSASQAMIPSVVPRAPGFVVAVIVSATTWRVFNRATVAQAYAEPAPGESAEVSAAS
jgi:MFS family permease